MDELTFIEDSSLRKTLENSIEYIYALYERSKETEQSSVFQEETCRVIILYVVSAIEAVLLYFYKVRGEKIEYPEYRFVHNLPKEFQYLGKAGRVVVAVQEKVQKRDHQIGLHDLVTFFKDGQLIQAETAADILQLNDVRNTFHLSKPRGEACNVERVEFALKILIRTLERAPRLSR